MAALPAASAIFSPGLRRQEYLAGGPSIPSLHPRVKVHPVIRHGSRLKNSTELNLNCRVPTVFASDKSSSNSDVLKDKVNESSSDVPNGPPLLTILAGVIVFLLVSWVLGSIVMWLVSLIINVPPS